MGSFAPLRVEGVSAGYRGVPVLREVTFEVGAGTVLGLVGPNGAGKSTLLDVVCGSLRPTAGRVLLFDRDVTRLPVHRRARLGLGRTFQRLEPFGSLNIAENLLVAAELPADRRREAPESVVRRLLRRFDLVDFADQPLMAVPTGIARVVEIARALAAGATVLLLDEPSSGMSGQQVEQFAGTVRALRADGLALVLVEHDPDFVDAVCDEVLELGTGTAAQAPVSRRAAGSRRAPSR